MQCPGPTHWAPAQYELVGQPELSMHDGTDDSIKGRSLEAPASAVGVSVTGMSDRALYPLSSVVTPGPVDEVPQATTRTAEARSPLRKKACMVAVYPGVATLPHPYRVHVATAGL